MSTIKEKVSGFTLVEVLIIAPVVIIVISGFIALIVAMVGDVMAIRDRNNMTFEIRDTLDRIEQDSRLSTQFLTSSSTLISPQGSDNNFNGTAAFSNSNSLIMGTLMTDKNPVDTTRQLIYYAKQPNDCGPLTTYNRPFIGKIIYFIKNSSLWRRSYLLPYNTNPVPNDETLCATPWQQNSCSPGYTSSRCQTNDIELMQNVSSFNVKYFASPQSTTEIGAANALTATTIEVTVNGQKTIVGRTITNSGSVRTSKLNNIDADLPIPATPTVTGQVTGQNTITFSWPTVPAATSYLISYNINGGAWVNATNDSTTLSYSVNAYRNDTVTIRVSAKNSSGTSPYSEVATTLPAWNACNLQNSWTEYGAPFATPSYTKTNNEIVYLKGLVKNGATAVGTVICTLPVGYRPNSQLVFLTSSSGVPLNEGGAARIDVLPTGEVIVVSANNGWLNLDSVRFVASTAPYTWGNIPMSNGWVYYGSPFATLQSTVDTVGRVHVQGLIKNGTFADWTTVGTLPNAQRPSHFGIMSTTSNTAYNAFGVANGGSSGLITARGINGSGYWSIQSRHYPYTFAGWSSLTLQNGWVAFDAASYSPPQYTKSADGVVTIRGLIRSGTTTAGTTIATLPVGYRPNEKIIQTVDAGSAWGRIDIGTNGVIEARVVNAGFTSLDSISFLAEQ